MRLKDVTEFCPAYTGATRSDAVAFVPMEALRYDCITQQEIPFAEARGKYTFFADGDLLFAKVTPCFENGNIAVATGLKGGIGFGSSENLCPPGEAGAQQPLSLLRRAGLAVSRRWLCDHVWCRWP